MITNSRERRLTKKSDAIAELRTVKSTSTDSYSLSRYRNGLSIREKALIKANGGNFKTRPRRVTRPKFKNLQIIFDRFT